MKDAISYHGMLLDAGYTGEQIREFLAWHKDNQWAWRWYDIEVLKEVRQGATRISSKHLFERMRVEFRREINNNYTAMFARIWAHKHPEFKDRFEFRSVKRRDDEIRGIFTT